MELKTKDLLEALELVNFYIYDARNAIDPKATRKKLKVLKTLCTQTIELRTLSWVTTKSGNKQLKYVHSMNNFDDVFGFIVEKKFEDKSKFLACLDAYNPLKDKSEYQLEAESENLAMAFVEKHAIAKGLLIRR